MGIDIFRHVLFSFNEFNGSACLGLNFSMKRRGGNFVNITLLG